MAQRELRMLTGCLMIFATACSAGDHAYRMEMAAIDEFHRHIALGQYEPIWASMDEKFRRSGDLSKEDLDSIRNLGEAKGFWYGRGAIQLGWYFPNHRVTLRGETQFTNGWAHETFEWMIEGERAVLKEYSIGPKYVPVLPTAYMK